MVWDDIPVAANKKLSHADTYRTSIFEEQSSKHCGVLLRNFLLAIHLFLSQFFQPQTTAKISRARIEELASTRMTASFVFVRLGMLDPRVHLKVRSTQSTIATAILWPLSRCQKVHHSAKNVFLWKLSETHLQKNSKDRLNNSTTSLYSLKHVSESKNSLQDGMRNSP